ncbi:MAG: AAA family ATPase [Pseudanabaenaceae cyanobacterium]
MSLPSLIRAMCQPKFYHHPVSEPIQVVQTHISFVILTGQYAYKIKKAVNFGFLDFSTLDLRFHFCHEEVRLNSRLAPDLYIGVVGITEDKILENDLDIYTEQIVEYAVKMYQFDQTQLAVNLFNNGQFLPEYAEAIGKRLAHFHLTAMTNDYIASFGTAQALKAVADDNYVHTAKYVGIAQTQVQLEQTRAYTDQIFNSKAELFSERIQQGKIRECHGDVHLQNICIYNNKIQIFDCIEFNEPFRNTDILYDAAFLVMDLQFRGRADLANIFLNTYLEITNDYAGVQLLPLFCSLRAYVRAKVTSFLLDDPNINDTQKQSALATAQKYYHLAWQYTRSQQGRIFLMSGVSGSGKSTQAKVLAQEYNGIIIRSDALRKHLAGIPLTEKGSPAIYTPAMTAQVYQQLLELGLCLAQAGQTVILDAKYDRASLRTAVISACNTKQIPVQIIYCSAPYPVLRDRLIQRQQANRDITDATVDLLDQQLAQFEEFTPEEMPYLHSNTFSIRA